MRYNSLHERIMIVRITPKADKLNLNTSFIVFV
jgi:hypothetical protein